MRHREMDYAMMPSALRSNLEVPWDLHMEEYPKLWRNSIYTSWKTGFPGEEVGLAMTFISTSHREFNSGRLVLDVSDSTAIWYLASKVDDHDDTDEYTGGAVEDDDEEDDLDDDDLDEDLQKTVTEVANKTDDSGFRNGPEDTPKIKPLCGPGTTWMGKVPSYSLRVPTVSTHSSMQMVSHSEEATGASFDAFLNAHADQSGISELMGGQALLRDYTTMDELKQLRQVADK